MSETCIVCLADFGESANELPRSDGPAVKSVDDDHGRLLRSKTKSPLHSNEHEDAMIAHLLPCGHNLHNDCLKPWVERANSCPICRQSFNLVELSVRLGGPVVSSYPVSDRIQMAEIDPSMLIEDTDDDLWSQPCPICGEDDNEDHLLSCDGCSVEFHTYCVDLDEIPVGHWFCETCDAQRAIESVRPTRSALRPHNTTARRTRGQRRQARSQASSSGWARVWQSVWDRLNIDLDFPFDESSNSSRTNRAQRELSHRRDFQQWERRFQVAERQGATNKFRDTASRLLDLRTARERPDPPEPESTEEIRAWNALDKAKEIQRDPSFNKRKRKSPTTSPRDADPAPEPQRPLKRPRTRRALDLAESSSDAPAEVPATRRPVPGPSNLQRPEVQYVAPPGNGPSFLQSLLKEVESSAAPDETKGQTRPLLLSTTGHSSPQVSSPGASPTTSNYASPRALSTTPPPYSSTRPGSPFSLTSKVEPIFPPPEFSPTRSPSEPSPTHRPLPESRQTVKDVRQPRSRNQISPGSNSPRSEDTSPSRINMSLSAKLDVQKMVSAALKPHYKNNAVSKDQYTDINRNISRMLYDKVGDTGNINGDARETWERLASDEVAKAVESLKAAVI